jgi:hypothetical protein
MNKTKEDLLIELTHIKNKAEYAINRAIADDYISVSVVLGEISTKVITSSKIIEKR